jgi:GNAT superfamily N-acetyltransferase
MTRYIIRKVDGADYDTADTLRRLHKETFTDGSPTVPTEYGHWWLLFADDEPVGFAGMYPSHSRKKAGYLCRSGILKAHRGLGLQTRLIRVRERQAKLLGWRLLVTDTSILNPASSNNLVKRGFRIFIPEKKWGYVGTLYWQKKLAA